MIEEHINASILVQPNFPTIFFGVDEEHWVPFRGKGDLNSLHPKTQECRQHLFGDVEESGHRFLSSLGVPIGTPLAEFIDPAL